MVKSGEIRTAILDVLTTVCKDNTHVDWEVGEGVEVTGIPAEQLNVPNNQ